MKTFVTWLEEQDNKAAQDFAKTVATNVATTKTRQLGTTTGATPPNSAGVDAGKVINQAVLDAASDPNQVSGAIKSVSGMKKKMKKK